MKWWNVIVLAVVVAFCASCAGGPTSEAGGIDDLPHVANQSVLETLQESLEYHEDELRGCIDAAGVQEDELAEGKVAYRLVVDESYNAVGLDVVESTVDQPDLEQCINNHLSEVWREDVAGTAKYQMKFHVRFWPYMRREIYETYDPYEETAEEDLEEIREESRQIHAEWAEKYDHEGAVGDFCDPADIQTGIGAQDAKVRSCYDEAARSAAEEGKFADFRRSGIAISATFRIAPAYSVKHVRFPMVTLTSYPSEFEDCLAEVVGQIQFSDPDGGMCDVNYPFVFLGWGFGHAGGPPTLDMIIGTNR